MKTLRQYVAGYVFFIVAIVGTWAVAQVYQGRPVTDPLPVQELNANVVQARSGDLIFADDAGTPRYRINNSGELSAASGEDFFIALQEVGDSLQIYSNAGGSSFLGFDDGGITWSSAGGAFRIDSADARSTLPFVLWDQSNVFFQFTAEAGVEAVIQNTQTDNGIVKIYNDDRSAGVEIQSGGAGPRTLTLLSGSGAEIIMKQGANTRAKINASGQIEGTIATGTAPLVVASATKVANLNVDQVDGNSIIPGTATADLFGAVTVGCVISGTTITATGATSGSACSMGYDFDDFDSNLELTCSVTSTNTVSIKGCCNEATCDDPGSATVNVRVIQ